jgi:hypothetical protein
MPQFQPNPAVGNYPNISIDATHLNLVYMLTIGFPDSGTKWSLLNFCREEAVAMGSLWTDLMSMLPYDHDVKADWIQYIQPNN